MGEFLHRAQASTAVADGAADEQLMERFCSGDAAAFDAIFERHAPAVFQFLLRLVRDPEQAKDLTQATFLSFVGARRRFRRGCRVAPWLFAIAGNAARDALRRRTRRPESAVPEGGFTPEPPAGPELAGAGVLRLVHEALEQLPAGQREAVILHRLFGLSFAEIAEELGTTVGAAKVRAHRGDQRLRELIGS